jgi:uncharacterized protein YbjT (DUF2867 family)
MLARGTGQLVSVASAAGLLSQCGDSAYSASKHAAVALAESLAIVYGDRGIEVAVACPQYVATAMTGLAEDSSTGASPGVLNVAEAARAIAEGIEAGRFLILTHPEVLGYFQRKAGLRTLAGRDAQGPRRPPQRWLPEGSPSGELASELNRKTDFPTQLTANPDRREPAVLDFAAPKPGGRGAGNRCGNCAEKTHVSSTPIMVTPTRI